MQRAELARRSGVSIDTLRFYEQQGVIPPPPRRPNGYRDYGPHYLRLVDFIRSARALGLPLERIRSMIGAAGAEQMTPEQVRAVVRARLVEVEEARRGLDELHAALSALLEVPDPHVRELIEVLAFSPPAS